MARSAISVLILSLFSVLTVDAQILNLNPADTVEELPQPSEVTFDRDLRIETETKPTVVAADVLSTVPAPTPRPPVIADEQLGGSRTENG